MRERVGLVFTSLSHYNPLRCDGMSAMSKPCGDGQVATGAGGGYHWRHLVTNLHVGDSGVMVVCC